MNSGASVSSLSIPLNIWSWLRILRVYSDQEPITEALNKNTIDKKNQTGIITLVLNAVGPIPSIIFTSEIEVEEKLS